MKTVQRNLSLADTYKVVNIVRRGIESGEAYCCENCGKGIVNTATLQNQKGESFIVGLDCAKTLSSKTTNTVHYQDSLYDFNQCLKFMEFYNKAISTESDEIFIYVKYLDKKGEVKEKSMFRYLLKDYGFDI